MKPLVWNSQSGFFKERIGGSCTEFAGLNTSRTHGQQESTACIILVTHTCIYFLTSYRGLCACRWSLVQSIMYPYTRYKNFPLAGWMLNYQHSKPVTKNWCHAWTTCASLTWPFKTTSSLWVATKVCASSSPKDLEAPCCTPFWMSNCSNNPSV